MIVRSREMTENERRLMKVPPWIVTGQCRCGREVSERVYGLWADVVRIEAGLKCKECR